MLKFCENAADLQPKWGTSMRPLRPPGAQSCSTRSLAKSIAADQERAFCRDQMRAIDREFPRESKITLERVLSMLRHDRHDSAACSVTPAVRLNASCTI
jgi:hypothetical protein